MSYTHSPSRNSTQFRYCAECDCKLEANEDYWCEECESKQEDENE